jgi:glycosyltransferase involved in cell wall biosynthesis
MFADPSMQRNGATPAGEIIDPRASQAGRSILMIDYFFPPIGGAAVRRTSGLVKHLAEFGWAPIVLTVRGGAGELFDPRLLETIPAAVRVERTVSLEPLRFARRLVRRSVDRGRNADGGGRSGRPWMGPKWISAAVKAVLFPDPRVGWFPFALVRALALHRVQRFQVIYSTSTSVTSHLIALALKRILHKPWVADFQDPWVDTELCSPGLRRTLGERLESVLLREANRVTFASDSARTALQQKYQLPPEKLFTLLLGFDPDAFDGLPPVGRTKFTITHFGSFYADADRSPVPFLEALGQSLQEHHRLAGDVEVLFFGSFDPAMFAQTEALLNRLNLKEIVRLAGVVPYTVGVQHLLSSHLLLLIQGHEAKDLIPTKLFDYLGTGRPILALLPDGDAAQIVRRANAGAVSDPDDVEAIKHVILDHYRKWKDGSDVGLTLDREVVGQCTVRELSRRFATILEGMLP